MTDRPQEMTIAVVGDVHHQWEEEDNRILEEIGIDLALFVGDFGNEAVEIVGRIASLNIPKAAVMGNHDAWYTASAWGRKKCPYDPAKEDRVRQQLDLLGEAHVGYGKLDIPHLNLSVVGSRPFSWGGPEWKNKKFLQERYEVTNFEQSQSKIVTNATQTAYETVIFLGHNGPLGLGREAEDICGRDWQPLGGDHGDPDFAGAIAEVRNLGKRIPLVAFGHMHHRLRHTQRRSRTAVKNNPTGTVYLNAACVPRIVEKEGEFLRNFSLVSWEDRRVKEISLVWIGKNLRLVSSQLLYRCQESHIVKESVSPKL